MKHLRQYIRKLIFEAMTPPSSLSNSHAIWSDYYSGGVYESAGEELNFAMYDFELAKRFIKEGIDLFKADYGEEGLDDATHDIVTDAIDQSIVAAIRVRTIEEGCNGAWEVIRSAATEGLGPTLYDVVMSISPQGLMSDRSSVSDDAKNVWSKYANQRGDVDKAFLDPTDLTVYEKDDCEAFGGQISNSSLWHLTRIMAVEYFRSEWPLEYETMEAEIDPATLEDWGTMSGDDYYDNVSMWIDANADLPEMEEWDFDTAKDGWYEWKMENELELINQKEGDFEDPDFLNVSYNTDYAENAYSDMEANHWNLKQFMEEQGLDPEWFDPDGEGPSLAVRDFFQGQY